MAVVRRTLPDGSSRYDARWRGPDGRQHQRTFQLKREAERCLRAQRLAVDEQRFVDPAAGRRRLDEVATEWRSARPAARPRTVDRDEIALARHILPVLGAYPVAKITTADVQRLVNAWTETMAPSTVTRTYGTLRSVLAFAERRRIIARTPASSIGLPAIEPDERPPLLAVEVWALADAIDPHHRALILTMASTGVRLGEALGLRLRNLDLDRGVVRVVEQLAPDGKTWSPPKTRAGRRSIPVGRVAIEAIEKHLVGRDDDPNEPVFRGKRGGPIQSPTWRTRFWTPATIAADVEATPHDLRRYYASTLVTSGIDIKTAMVRMGHTDPRMLLSLYARLAAELDRTTADVIDAALAGETPGLKAVNQR